MRVIKANFHTHTKASNDGYNSYSAIYKRAKKVGLDVIAITDHDTIAGALGMIDWLSVHNKKDLDIIIGEEITCLDGTHIIGLFLHSHIGSYKPVDVIKEIKKQNAIVYFPHPSRKDGIMCSDEFEQAIGFGDYFEVYNGKVNQGFNELTIEEFNKHDHMLPLGGSDAHYNADLSRCICEISVQDKFSLAQVMKEKKIDHVKIMGHVHQGSTQYFSAYYDMKNKLNLPQWVRDIGKIIFPIYKNVKERNKAYDLIEVFVYEY